MIRNRFILRLKRYHLGSGRSVRSPKETGRLQALGEVWLQD